MSNATHSQCHKLMSSLSLNRHGNLRALYTKSQRNSNHTRHHSQFKCSISPSKSIGKEINKIAINETIATHIIKLEFMDASRGCNFLSLPHGKFLNIHELLQSSNKTAAISNISKGQLKKQTTLLFIKNTTDKVERTLKKYKIQTIHKSQASTAKLLRKHQDKIELENHGLYRICSED